jgi:nitrite reductase/ring-hydroxylating ferredoxin subunit
MPEPSSVSSPLAPMPLRSLDAHPGLVVASVYERALSTPIDPVWENVFDWEHLPWLHDQAFRSVTLRASGDWGWHADVELAAGPAAEIELVVDPARSCYVARTRSGAGMPGEIWTRLDAVTPTSTAVRVEFRVAPMPEAALQRVGEAYRALYRGLWDQDEVMIEMRLEALRARAEREAAGSGSLDRGPRDLGPLDALRPRLPLVVGVDGHRFRIVEHRGTLLAHAVECPHWLGPLDDCDPSGGELVCPWHGYRFDPTTGRSSDGRGLRLRRAPRVEVDPGSGHVRLVAD